MDIFMRNIAYAAKEIDVRIALAEKLHRPPFPIDPPLNFSVHIFNSKKRGSGMLTLPTQEVGDTFLRTYGHTGIMVKGREIRFRLSDKPVKEGRVRHIRSIPWEDPSVLEERNRQKAADSQPIKLQGYAFGHFCRDGSFLVDSDTLGNGDIACDLDRRQIRLTVRQDTSDVPEMVDDLNSAINGLHLPTSFDMSHLFSPTKFASYIPPQIKTVIATDPSQTPHLVILDSDTPPIFESRTIFNTLNIFGASEDMQSSDRLASLHDDRQMSPRCHSLCLTFPSHDESLIFLQRCRGLGLTSIQTREDEIHTRHVSHNDAMVELNRQLLAMKFELAFEVEKAVLNGDLEPLEIHSLGSTIHAISNTASGLPPAAFRLFVTTLQDFRPAFLHRHRRRMRSGGSITTTKASGLSLDQQLIDATMYYSAETSLKMTSFLVSPATFKCYHLIVTPTSRYLEGPIADQSNSILRRFGNHECFLRVSIQGERRSKLRREPGIDISKLLQSRFGGLLVHGLRLGGRQYEFLGYSMSGLREHSVWFVTPFESSTGHMDAAKIREKLGNFSELAYEPARLAARWSQAFSATDPSVTLKAGEIRHIDDRISAQGSVFTDGCGTISPELSRAVWAKLKRVKARYSNLRSTPSCIQFRLGGAKGIAVQDPNLDGKVICIRPSQTKFDGLDNLTLDIQSTSSRAKPMFLNRPLIMLLEHLGVASDVIIDLQSTSIREVQAIQTSLNQATKVFLQHSLGASYHLPSLFNNISKYLGLEISDRPIGGLHHHLIKEALYCAATHALREIKYRAHILVPGSFTLLGVSDEYDCLAEGEIFATVYDESKEVEQAIEGQVLITRSPQVHPGDVQLVTAVRRAELTHLKNVVVFSCRGQRSLQSCLGGGDIDGDDYNVILDPKLHPHHTATPGAYMPLERKRTEEPCTVNDVADFIINFIQTDLVGYISILHLRIADLKGPDCDECMQLAEAASHAVDFPKTGTPANFTNLPRPPSQERPDFLAPEMVNSADNNLYYPSDKILGVLFRNVPSAKRPILQYNPSNTPSDGNSILNALMEIDLSELGLPPLLTPQDDLVEEMEQLLEAYSEHLVSIGRTHAISKSPDARVSEEELISGTITAKWSDHRKRREAVVAMNLQTHELCTSIRRELQRVSIQDSDNGNFPIYEDEEGEIDEDELIFEKRAEVFSRAWAAWKVTEDTLANDPPDAFGLQSFGLIALGLLLDVIKDVTKKPY